MTALDVLRREFDRAARAGVPREMWWRDDDAVTAGPRLDALGRLAASAGAPIAIAAIPARADATLLAWCEDEGVDLVQHGVAHENHEPSGKPSELGFARGTPAIVASCLRARELLDGSPAFVPVMVPPWNRMRDDLAPALGLAGWRGVSRFGGPARPGRIDAHIDPIAWRSDRSLLPAAALARMAEQAVATAGPIGLLTHHAVHTPDVDDFVAAFAGLVADHPGASWVGVRALFP